ncbi:MAG: hypothetical protein IH892_05755 [Planctomycetes bacterium]|nr:hypothetical protein [Planctomycetota bacterium]
MCHKLTYLLLSFLVLNFCLASSLQAQMIGAGADLDATVLDTANDRINITKEFPAGTVASEVFAEGRYEVSEFAFKANPGGGGGFLRPFLAKGTSSSPLTYETVWVGPRVVVTLDGVDTVNFASGAEIFTLSQSTEVFGGVYHDGIAKVYTNLQVGVTDHDNAGPIEPTDVEQAVGDFSHVDLPRSYAFGITVISAVPLGSAAKPSPARETTDVPRDSVLSWAPGAFAASTRGHIVYFGESFDDVNDASGGAAQDAASYTPPERVDFGTTYYWRVDEVNSPPDSTVYRGEVWSFTVEPFSIPLAGVTATASSSFGASVPEKTVDGSGLVDDGHGTSAADMWISGGIPATLEYAFDRAYKLHELWIWNSNQLIEAFVGFGAKDVVIEHSLDGENWTVLDGVGPLAQAPGTEGYAHNTTIDFGGATAQHVRLTVNSVQGIAPQASLSEVRFYYIPTFATRPNPETGATDVSPDVPLAWGRDGREAGSHDVYVGTDANNLSLAASVGESSLDTQALDLQLGQTYHWRVDEINDVMDPSTWEGTAWSFTTADAINVDDMESYRDEEFLEIWATWIDGFGDEANNGALVGANPGIGDFLPESTVVHDGSQSLPLHFDNSAASVSEATRTFDQTQDWTRSGIQTLVLYFKGGADNTGGSVYLKINDTKMVYEVPAGLPPGWDAWTQWTIDLSAVADAASVRSLTIGVEGAGARGVIYVDSIQLFKNAPTASEPLSWFEAESGTITAPMQVFSDSPTASAGQHIGTVDGIGDENGNPPADGVATYSLTVPEDGVYRLAIRVIITGGSNSFWFRIPGMVTNTTNHASGWVRFNDIQDGATWHWDEVRSSDDGDSVVEFTLSAGTHTLEIARREDGTLLDAIAVVQ